MATLVSLKRKLDTIDELQSVVKTMKALAAVNIRLYEQATESLEVYNEAVERGLQAVLMKSNGQGFGLGRAPSGPLAAVVFGSDQGMAGQFNEQIVEFSLETLQNLDKAGQPILLVVGERAETLLESRGATVDSYLAVPTSTTGISSGVQDILMQIEDWRERLGVAGIFLFFNLHVSGASHKPTMVRLLPLDETWLAELKKKAWPGRGLPFFNMDPDQLFSGLIRQYLFVSIYRAFAQSLASENASRLAAMQNAEKNIEDRLAEVKTQYHQERQSAITEELLDIVAGFSALTEKKKSRRRP